MTSTGKTTDHEALAYLSKIYTEFKLSSILYNGYQYGLFLSIVLEFL